MFVMKVVIKYESLYPVRGFLVSLLFLLPNQSYGESPAPGKSPTSASASGAGAQGGRAPSVTEAGSRLPGPVEIPGTGGDDCSSEATVSCDSVVSSAGILDQTKPGSSSQKGQGSSSSSPEGESPSTR
jgi:hypothetical protein